MALSSGTRPACIILAGGRGTRMRSSSTHKVCFPIVGRPAILRAIDAYQDAGIGHIQVVVGAMAGQVVETVGKEYPRTSFVYQPEQLGTGNATRVGAAALQEMNFTGSVVVTMGDKIINPHALRKLLTMFNQQHLDVALGVLPAQPGSEGGKVLLHPDGRLAGIVEKRDTQRAAIMEEIYKALEAGMLESSAALETLEDVAKSTIPDDNKRLTALGPVAVALEARDNVALRRALESFGPDSYTISLGRSRFTVADVQASTYQNSALYVFSAPALYEALRHISANNAQKEEYLTDAVTYLANSVNSQGEYVYQVGYSLLDPAEVLTYNNPEELLAVEEQVRQQIQPVEITAPEPPFPPGAYRPVGQWLQILDQGTSALQPVLQDIYGPNEELWYERLEAIHNVLEHFAQRHGYNRKVIVVRAPGRINIMGRHVEHRGGNVNVMAINKEAILVAAMRDDDKVCISNVDPETYPDAEFCMGEEIAGLPWDDWMTYINHERVQKLVSQSRGLWVNYVKAAFLRLQFQFRNQRVRGMDAVFSSNIPVAAGLSSSSAIVVASAEAAAALNGLGVAPQDFVDLCGEGEWYVGSRGGAGDHAAVKFSQLGYVTQIGFFPFKVGQVLNLV